MVFWPISRADSPLQISTSTTPLLDLFLSSLRRSCDGFSRWVGDRTHLTADGACARDGIVDAKGEGILPPPDLPSSIIFELGISRSNQAPRSPDTARSNHRVSSISRLADRSPASPPPPCTAHPAPEQGYIDRGRDRGAREEAELQAAIVAAEASGRGRGGGAIIVSGEGYGSKNCSYPSFCVYLHVSVTTFSMWNCWRGGPR